MKKSLLTFTAFIVILMALLLTLAPSAQAQVTGGPRVYLVAPLGITNLQTLKTYTNTANVAFPIPKGRGFSWNLGVFTTNAVAPSNIVGVFHFATPITNGTTVVTNWNTATPLSVTAPVWTNGMFWFTNIGPLTVDNVALGKLFYISNAGTADVLINWTNTFTGRD